MGQGNNLNLALYPLKTSELKKKKKGTADCGIDLRLKDKSSDFIRILTGQDPRTLSNIGAPAEERHHNSNLDSTGKQEFVKE